MHAIVQDNNIIQFINQPKSIVVGDVRYPAKIFELWSQSEKEAIGIYEVVTDNTNYKDPEYYINTNEQYTFADGQVTKSWGTATAKQLEDTNATDEDGNELDPVEVIKGLKSQKKDIVKQEASQLLSPTDWYVVKASEVADYSVPSNITTFRADVRTKSNEMETMIDNCTTVDELKALYEYTEQEDGTITRPLPEFPEEI
jgi:hypothetical protein